MSHHLTARLLDFLSLTPTPISHIFHRPLSSLLMVCRRTYSQICHVSINSNQLSIQQILVLEPCQQMYELEDNVIVMVMEFQVKISWNGKWAIYPFTTQLLKMGSIYENGEQGEIIYTFHVNQVRKWNITKSRVDIRHLNANEAPYHVKQDGSIQGYGKKIPKTKNNRFTTLHKIDGFLFAGTESGQVSIYQTKYLTHVKTFHRHQASILSITSSNKKNVVYFTGSDSKISSIVNLQGDHGWVLSKEVRGQSHDVMSLSVVFVGKNQFLVSGGITTDVCVNRIDDLGILSEEFQHKIGYSSQRLAQVVNNYLIANKHNSFQIWKLSKSNNKQDIQLLVKFDLTFNKTINQLLVKSQQNQLMLFIATQQQATLWSFEQQKGLNKLLTVKNNYNLAKWYKKQSIITLRDGNRLQLFNHQNGSISQISQTSVQFPTDLQIDTNRVIVGSKITRNVEMYRVHPQKGGKKVGEICLNQSYNILDFCQYNSENFMIKNISDQILKEYDRNGNFVCDIVKLPVKKIRDFGWLSYQNSQKVKSYWYAVSEGKIVIVTRMKMAEGERKIRVKQMLRIGAIVAPSISLKKKKNQNINFDWNLGVIPLNFTKMIEMEIQPIMTKKIM